MPQKQNQELFDSEWTIMKVVWDHEPVAAPDVQEYLQEQKGWAYTTVKTLMDRMVKKGLLKTERVRNLYLYRAGISRFEARKKELLKTLRRAFDGAFAPMMQFLVNTDQLSDQDIEALQQLLKQKKCESRKSDSSG